MRDHRCCSGGSAAAVTVRTAGLAVLVAVVVLFGLGSAATTEARAAAIRPHTVLPVAPSPAAMAVVQRELGGGARVAFSRETGMLRFIGTEAGKPMARPAGLSRSAAPTTAARAFLQRYETAFAIRDQAQELRVTSVKAASARRSVVRFQQLHTGVPVIGGELVVNLTASGEMLSVSGETLPVSDLSVVPRVTSSAAADSALTAVAKAHGVAVSELRTSTPVLSIYDSRLLGGPGLATPALVWRMDVAAVGGGAINDFVLIDARLGAVALRFDQVERALYRAVCDANNTYGAQVPCTTPVRVEGQEPVALQDVNDAYTFMGDVYTFYSGTLGRDSLDAAGMPLKSTVRYCDPSYTCPYPNAYWNGSQMIFGQGYAAADDVVGHEMTHGVTDKTSHLFYFYQSGAINESLSDVLGEFIDLTNGRGTDTAATRWLMGEDIPGGAIRSMSNPPAYGDPDTMTSPNYYGGTSDNGGVHTNGGVNNKAAFLMTDGGSFNGRTVTGIGITKAAHIYYEVDVNMLTSAGDYADLSTDLQQACTNLIGTAGITGADCTSVTNAVQAVDMSVIPPAAPNPEAPVCSTGQSAFNLFSDNLENPGNGNWVTQTLVSVNNWYYPQIPNPFDFDATYATSGSTNFWAYDRESITDSAIALTRDVTIPAGVPVYLRFNHAFLYEATYDGGVVEYSTNGGATWTDAGPLPTDNGYNGTLSASYGNPLGGRSAFTGVSNGYISSRADLSRLAGQSIRIRFRSGTDSSTWNYGWFVDDIRIYSCALPTPTATTGAASGIGTSTATIAGTVNPNGSPTGYRFDYGTSSGYGSSTALGDAGTGTANIAASAPLSGLTANTTYHYRVVALRGGSVAATGADQTFTTQAPPPPPPVNISAPSIAGTPTPGAMLSCSPGRWSGASSLGYQWLRDGSSISGQSAQTLALRTGDLGHRIACRVNASNAYGSTSATSPSVRVVDLAPPRLSGAKLKPSSFSSATSGASVVLSGRAGTLITFTLNEPATVTFSGERSQTGRIVGHRCRPQTSSNRKAKPCSLFVTVQGSFNWSGKTGANTFRFTGRINGRRLARGSYRLVASARDLSGNLATPVRIPFKVR